MIPLFLPATLRELPTFGNVGGSTRFDTLTGCGRSSRNPSRATSLALWPVFSISPAFLLTESPTRVAPVEGSGEAIGSKAIHSVRRACAPSPVMGRTQSAGEFIPGSVGTDANAGERMRSRNF